MTVFIYILADSSGVARYIGKANDPSERLELHLKRARLGYENTHKANWLRKLLRLGNRPGLLVVEECDESAWQERERFWIAEYRRRGADLTNATDGGEGLTRITPAHRAKLNAGVARPEVREKIGARTRGVKLSPEHRARIGNAQRGVKKTPNWPEIVRASWAKRRTRPQLTAEKTS